MRFNTQIRCLLLAIALLTCTVSFAQLGTPVDSATVNAGMKKCAIKYPKFYREFSLAKANDQLIKNFIFVRYDNDTGPAKAGPKGNIFIDIKYLETEQPGFDDNRLIVVLYHEIGHLHYFVTTPEAERDLMQNEKFAFEYSLMKTKEMALAGDCLPLKTGVKFMKIRSEGTNLQDSHVRALKLMVTEPLYAGYVQFVKEKCPD